ncbi:MAG: glycosyltransferase family 39 protein [Candidatus Eisenbacteria bacterium]
MRPSSRFTSASPALLAMIGVVLLATRWPLLVHGYGSDDDAWRYVVSALHTRASGAYQPSRVPGFPAFELPLALLVPLGPFATNLVAAFAGLLGAWLFWRIARRLQHPRPGFLALGLALTPAFWVQATQTMDYAQATAFLLAGWLALLQARAGWAGVWLALAAASRPTLVLIAPIAGLYLMLSGARWGSLARFAVGFGVVFTGLELPAMLHPDTQGASAHFAFHAARQHVTFGTLVPVVRGAIVFLVGKLGAPLLLIGLGLGWRSRDPRARLGAPIERDASLVFELFSLATIALLYLLVPLDTGYLIPALPLVLSLAARIALPGWLLAALVAVSLETLAQPLLGAGRIVPGRLVLEVRERQRQIDEAKSEAIRVVSQPTVFIASRPLVHRMVVLAPFFTREPAAWKPFWASGVALWSPDRRRGYAVDLSPAERAALEVQGYAIVKLAHSSAVSR